MLKMVFFALVCSLCFLGLTNAGQESSPFSLLSLHDPKLTHTGVPVAVSVSSDDLREISSSVLMAESWLRTHVLSYFPATQITTIVVGSNVLCNREHKEIWGLVLPCMKNLHHSLARWGLEKEIKLSSGVSRDCLNPFFDSFKDEKVMKPLLEFLQSSNSTYCVNPPPEYPPLSEKTIKLVASHMKSMKKLGYLEVMKVNVLTFSQEGKKPRNRKLSSMSVDPYPARPTPLPEIPPSPIHQSIGYSVPANVVMNPPPYLPPLFPGAAPSPSMGFSSAPEFPPALIPSSAPPPAFGPLNPPPALIPTNPPPTPTFIPSDPPEAFTFPPCTPPPAEAPPTPVVNPEEQRLWCVAKPSVPTSTLQEAMDYACGDGGADCEEIKPNGSCYSPDTIVAHASYAFNSYWQKNKRNGGSCNFGGTAMVINSDPSFQQCKFILSIS